MKVTDAPTEPRVDAHLPGPGETWVPKGVDPSRPPEPVIVTSRDHVVHYDIFDADGNLLLHWCSSLSMFMEHYRRAVDTHVMDGPDARRAL